MIIINTIEIKTYDSLEYLKALESKSIGLAIYDAPYFSTGIKEVGDKQWKNEDEYINWCLEIIKETQRVLKDNGSFYWFHNDINIMVEVLHKIKHETEFKLKNQITWSKINNWKSANIKDGAGMYRSILQCYGSQRSYNGSLTEYIYYFTFQNMLKDEKIFNKIRSYFESIQKQIGTTKKHILEKVGQRADHCFRWNSSQWDFPTEETYNALIKEFNINNFFNFREYSDLKIEYENLKYSFNQQEKVFKGKQIIDIREELKPYTTVWEYDRDEAYNLGHITPKPLEMIKHIIKVSSREGDVILDIFNGSGTSSLATLEVGNRNFKGCDMNLEFNRIAETRLNTYISEHNLQDININIS